jgi:hypothetical protein
MALERGEGCSNHREINRWFRRPHCSRAGHEEICSHEANVTVCIKHRSELSKSGRAHSLRNSSRCSNRWRHQGLDLDNKWTRPFG